MFAKIDPTESVFSYAAQNPLLAENGKRRRWEVDFEFRNGASGLSEL
jgi:hypothetical protein